MIGKLLLIIICICLFIIMLIIREKYKPLKDLKYYMRSKDDLDNHYLCYLYNKEENHNINPIDKNKQILSKTKNRLKEKCKQMTSIDILEKLRVRNDEHSECKEQQEYNETIRNNLFKWNIISANNDTCTTRQKVLSRDSENQSDVIYIDNRWFHPICSIDIGKWRLPIEDNRIVHNPNLLDIDHHVPLKDAYISGGCLWNSDTGKTYANDMTPGHLNVTSYSMNRTKGDKSPDKFNISSFSNKMIYTGKDDFNHYDCKYAADWVAIKYRYNLSVTPSEKSKLKHILSECQNVYPTYPILYKDKLGYYLDIIEKNKNILLYPLQENTAIYNKNILKQKWIERCKQQTRQFPIDELMKDIENNQESLGIHNLSYIKQKYATNTNRLCDIITN